MLVEIPIENAELKYGHGNPFLIVEACPFMNKHHPLDEWFSRVREAPYKGDLFEFLPAPKKLKLAIEQFPESGVIHGDAKLYLNLENKAGAGFEKFRIRCAYNDYERTHRVLLSSDDSSNNEFLQLLAKEIERHQVKTT